MIPIGSLVAEGAGLMVWCAGERCPALWTYLPPARALAVFGPNLTLEEASLRARCAHCGARGRDRRVQVLPSTLDQDALRHGRAIPAEGVEVARRRAWGLSDVPGR